MKIQIKLTEVNNHYDVIVNNKLRFVLHKISKFAPEQYELLNIKDELIGYFRLRGGYFSVGYDFSEESEIYSHTFKDERSCFDSEKEAIKYLKEGIKSLVLLILKGKNNEN